MVRSRTSPAPGAGTSACSIRKSDGFGSPTGREARTTRFADCGMMTSFFPCSRRAPGRQRLYPARIVRAFARDRHVVNVAFAQARAGDAHELRLVVKFGEIFRPDISHCR